MKKGITLDMDRAIYNLVKTYDEWLADDVDDADLIDAACTFCREWAERSGYQQRMSNARPH